MDSIQTEIAPGQGYVPLMSRAAQLAVAKGRSSASQMGFVLSLV